MAKMKTQLDHRDEELRKSIEEYWSHFAEGEAQRYRQVSRLCQNNITQNNMDPCLTRAQLADGG